MLCKPSSRRFDASNYRTHPRAKTKRNHSGVYRNENRRNSSPCHKKRRCLSEKVSTRYQRSQQYSVTALTNGGGSVVERYAYSAYGTPTITDGSGVVQAVSSEVNRYLYTGREWDEELSLYHYRARMYDSVGGRFCGRDPIGYKGSKWGLYEFLSGSPVIMIDPLGLSDVILFPEGSDRYNNARDVPKTPGVITVVGHSGSDKDGNRTVMKPDGNGKYIPISDDELIERVRKTPRHKEGMDVLLVVCLMANGEYPKKIADKLKCKVLAYEPCVTLRRKGIYFASKKKIPWWMPPVKGEDPVIFDGRPKIKLFFPPFRY